MYYDQLLALKRDLDILMMQVINDYSTTQEEKVEKLALISKEKSLVEEKINNYHMSHSRVSGTLDQEQIKTYKKQIKHEFLTQARNGYSLSEILPFLEENYQNPGINLEKYVTRLRHPFKYFDDGYFVYEDPSLEDSQLFLTSKGVRYLENEANVSLKR